MKTLFTAINHQGVLFVFPVPVASPDARILEWHRSLREGAETAMSQKWVRIRAKSSLGAYGMWRWRLALSRNQPGRTYRSRNCCVLPSATGYIDQLGSSGDQTAARSLMQGPPYRGRRFRI